MGVLVEGREQRLQRRLWSGGRRLLQGAEVGCGVGGRRAVAGVRGAKGGGGRGREARGGVQEGLVVEEKRALVDERLDDCLVGARGG